MIIGDHTKDYLPAIKQLPVNRPLEKDDLLNETFLLSKENNLRMYYAPHNEYLNQNARIVIVGITPGWQQMKKAYEQVLQCVDNEQTEDEDVLKQAKWAARFSGSMRRNLINMLDECGLPDHLGLASSAELFSNKTNLLHTTSVIKYPVFYNGKNYTGHQPNFNQSSMLHTYVQKVFPTELQLIEGAG
ncbi:uncharacterized protein JNUCC1_00199 [Lentibacillus sp. JNUCC-1]|uniref:hypothetical protein n=1 Tax=Lentibacillus sp. JNUCC-1 TaxID=2654513 RepID=UPI001321BEC1|nr:hypothetical protein [Lentibacillus sp. JNUCC-1]MUV36397.1 uncharacterized protein [Lentibacillus sp. JNUCC-1]